MKTSELTGVALDWAVAKCEGAYLAGYAVDWRNNRAKKYSTNWSLGGPIIERERIHIRPNQSNNGFKAFVIIRPHGLSHRCDGPTPLIAAIRCYVASKLGDEVEIPEELT